VRRRQCRSGAASSGTRLPSSKPPPAATFRTETARTPLAQGPLHPRAAMTPRQWRRP
jgi:hypothetical protein